MTYGVEMEEQTKELLETYELLKERYEQATLAYEATANNDAERMNHGDTVGSHS